MLTYTYLDIDGFSILNNDISTMINGLFDSEQNIITNELYTDGSSYNRSKIKEKKLLLNIIIKNDIMANFLALRQKLFKSGEKILKVGIEGMPLFYLKVELLNWVTSSLGFNIFSCQLQASDPYLYDTEVESVVLGSTSNASLVLPTVLPFILGDITGGQGTITNTGNAMAYPIITIVGTCDTITITNSTTGESMSLNISLLDSDTLVIDNTPSNRGIYLNGVKRMDLKNGYWFSCPVGDNLFTFSRNSLQTKQHCIISLQNRWI